MPPFLLQATNNNDNNNSNDIRDIDEYSRRRLGISSPFSQHQVAERTSNSVRAMFNFGDQQQQKQRSERTAASGSDGGGGGGGSGGGGSDVGDGDPSSPPPAALQAGNFFVQDAPAALAMDLNSSIGVTTGRIVSAGTTNRPPVGIPGAAAVRFPGGGGGGGASGFEPVAAGFPNPQLAFLPEQQPSADPFIGGGVGVGGLGALGGVGAGLLGGLGVGGGAGAGGSRLEMATDFGAVPWAAGGVGGVGRGGGVGGMQDPQQQQQQQHLQQKLLLVQRLQSQHVQQQQQQQGLGPHGASSQVPQQVCFCEWWICVYACVCMRVCMFAWSVVIGRSMKESRRCSS